MKRSLLSGCAALALVAGAGSALAQSAPGKFAVNIGGDAWFTAAYINQQGDVDQRTTEFLNRVRLAVTPTARADNGMEYGGRIRIRAARSTAMVDMDQAFLFVSGNFGRIEAGAADSPNYQYYTGTVNLFGTGGVDGDWTNTDNGIGGRGVLTNQTTFLEPYFGGGLGSVTGTNNNTKLSYFTPRFFGKEEGQGLMGMASYVPTAGSITPGVPVGSVNTDVNRAARTSNGALAANVNEQWAYSDVFEVGARYDGTVGGVTVAASAAYMHGTSKKDFTAASGLLRYNDLDAVQVGTQLSYAGVTIGASFVDAFKSGYSRMTVGNFAEDQYTYVAGIAYQTGPWSIGFNYQYGQDAGDTSVRGSRSADLYSVGATYQIAPGLATGIEYLKSETRNETGTTLTRAASGNADLVLWRTMLTF